MRDIQSGLTTRRHWLLGGARFALACGVAGLATLLGQRRFRPGVTRLSSCCDACPLANRIVGADGGNTFCAQSPDPRLGGCPLASSSAAPRGMDPSREAKETSDVE